MRTLSQLTQSFMGQLQKTNSNLQEKIPKTQNSNQGKYRQNSEQASETAEFIHPIFTRADYRDSIANYNRHIKKYNIEVWKMNAKIRDYNREVIRFRKENQASITDDQQAKEFIWRNNRKDLPPEEYNKLVEAYNEKEGGFWIRQRNLKEEVKPASEKVFVAILYELNVQLFKRKDLRQRLGVNIPSAIPAVKIYPNKIIERKRDGVENLPISKTSFANHRRRLEEAGVLLDYSFHGPNRPVRMRINPDILVVTDNEKPKKAATDNQAVSSEITCKVKYSNVSSRNSLDKLQLRVKGDLPQPMKTEKGQIRKDCTEYFYRIPTSQSSESIRPHSENTKKLLAEIDSAENFAQNLSAGAYNSYRRIDVHALEHEALYGSMDQEDFVELATQDTFAFAAELWKNKDVHPGSWVNAIKIWKSEMFSTPNGYLISKPNILSRWNNHIAVLEAVKKYSERYPDWDIRYPSLYFDPVRTEKEDSSFAYAVRTFRLEKTPDKSKKQRKLAHLRKTRAKTDLKKAQDKTKQYLRQKISLDQLYDYVENNCNNAVWQDINNIIKTEFTKFKK